LRTSASIGADDYSRKSGRPGAAGPQTRWYIGWTLGDAVKFVRAASDGTFVHGTLDGTSYSTEGDTSGKFHPGADGVIEVVIPGGSAPKGKKLEAPYVEVKNAIAHPAGAAFAPGADPDRAPDADGGKAYTVAACDAGTPPPPTPAPATSEQEVQHGALVVAAPAQVKVPKKRSLALKLTSSGKVTDLEARLSKGKTQLGTGKLATLDKKGTLKLKLGKKARKGSYSLLLIGTNPDGKRADKTVALKLK
jgi:hypothetical protein